MSAHLTPGQKALLEAALVQRQHQLERSLDALQQGLSRAEHAREVLLEDVREAPQREGAREIDMALSDLELREAGEVSAALARLRSDRYGLCRDCEGEIPFDRLKAEPWALRCVECESLDERARRA
ncbi:MAG: TraR/DksA C4-type zinc finger protein [Burkholderiales bacterium]|nr:TraR/DksA C4-type zinc finger protein [Burkholderiales bacterium]MDE2393796.1 TraR/DksA C4-type zinc finger protein [Burkholderiales bacterium]MDE2455672.1 TraR/DksA C4-type zinc finger protein [Burkholderiales bacterium]